MSPDASVAELVDRVEAAIAGWGGPPPGVEECEALVRREAPLLESATVRRVASALAGRFGGLDLLGRLLGSCDVSEVMINGSDVWVERRGRLERVDLRLDRAALSRIIEAIVGPASARVDRASPIADVRLPDGSRANIVLPPIACDGPCVTIRRFVHVDAALEGFAAPDVAALFRSAVRRRANLVVAGGTGSGKTTLLNALAGAVPATERIVTIEDTAELRLDHPHVVRLEARRANTEGVGEVGIRTLVRTALRMRPDRIIVGEVRGAEALDMAQAMNTGHEGSMSTCHANSPGDVLRRLEAMALLDGPELPLSFVRSQLSCALHLVVHVTRRADGARAVSDVVAVEDGAEWSTGRGLRPLVKGGRLVDENWPPADPRG